jgi:Conserved hypothetical protein 95
MRTQLRIVAGSLRGRKLSCTVNANLRWTPRVAREARFSIIGVAEVKGLRAACGIIICVPFPLCAERSRLLHPEKRFPRSAGEG